MRTPAHQIARFVRCAAWGCLAGLAAASAASARDLSSMSGEEITILQQRLTDAGCYSGAIDGTASPALQASKKACPDQEPILRIETGMHVAMIRRIGVDSQCRIAATGSSDKTVRVWSMPDGRLTRTQRLPIGDGLNGEVYAVAVSPDGRLVAAGGYDAHSAVDKTAGVYVFDTATGASVRRIGAFEAGIHPRFFARRLGTCRCAG
jgi:WD40 repeat protein